MVMGESSNLVDCQKRLAHSYSIYTGENEHFAQSAIRVVIAILSAGYFESISRESPAVAGMIQVLDKKISEGFDETNRNLGELQYNFGNTQHFQKQQTNIAKAELSKILSLRAFGSTQPLKNLLSLLSRTTESGDIFLCNDSVKMKIRYWAARTCASEKNLSKAKELREKLQESDLILDALILDKEDDSEAALRLLRDDPDPDSRSVFFNLLRVNKGAKYALNWFDTNAETDDLGFFTSFGWCSWAICAATAGRWNNVVEILVNLEDQWDEYPALSFLEGGINAALLLPEECRDMVLDGLPLYRGISPIYDSNSNVVEFHYRATYCFQYVEDNLSQLLDKEFNSTISDWQLWLRLMNPSVAESTKVRTSLGTQFSDPNQAVRLIRFAHFLNIEFNPQPLKDFLDKRRVLGGLDSEEQIAEFFLNQKILEPPQFFDYVDLNKDQLSQILQVDYLIAEYCNVMSQDTSLSSECKQLIDENRQIIDDQNYERMFDVIEANQGIDVRGRLEKRFRETGSTVDLKESNSIFLKPLTIGPY